MHDNQNLPIKFPFLAEWDIVDTLATPLGQNRNEERFGPYHN